MALRRTLAALLVVVGVLTAASAPAIPAAAATAPVYGDYSMMLVGAGAAGQFWSGDQAGGKWEWDTVSATESRISWGDPAKWPPTYHEQFIRQTDAAGDWVRLPGWFDNGVFYKIQTTTEWQAAADCRTGRTFLPNGGAQHYVRWTIPSSAYCLYAEGDVIEQTLAGALTGNTIHFVHQQVWSPPVACPSDAYGLTAPSCISQWESWSDSSGTPLQVKLERTDVLARGLGPAWNIRQTYPSVWGADLRWVRSW
jgi:hypothetical protein